MLSLADGASRAAVCPAGDTPTENTAITLDEEEISDVSLSTFYVFDNENAGAHRPGLRLAKKHTHGGGAAQSTEAAEAVQWAAEAVEAAQAAEGRMVCRVSDRVLRCRPAIGSQVTQQG